MCRIACLQESYIDLAADGKVFYASSLHKISFTENSRAVLVKAKMSSVGIYAGVCS